MTSVVSTLVGTCCFVYCSKKAHYESAEKLTFFYTEVIRSFCVEKFRICCVLDRVECGIAFFVSYLEGNICATTQYYWVFVDYYFAVKIKNTK